MSNYTLQNFNFSFQMISVSKTVVTSTALLTLFDNDADDATLHANRLRGMIIELTDSTATIGHDHSNSSTQIGTAKLLHDFSTLQSHQQIPEAY